MATLAYLAFPGVVKAEEIVVQNESGATVKLTASEIAAWPHQTLSMDDHNGCVSSLIRISGKTRGLVYDTVVLVLFPLD